MRGFATGPVHVDTGRGDLIDQLSRNPAEAVVRIPLAMEAVIMDVSDPFAGPVYALGDFPVLRVHAAYLPRLIFELTHLDSDLSELVVVVQRLKTVFICDPLPAKDP